MNNEPVPPVVLEYADLLLGKGHWHPEHSDLGDARWAYERGAHDALRHLAGRIGITDLHAQASAYLRGQCQS